MRSNYPCIFFNENVLISIKISLTLIPNGPINDIPALVQIMAWHKQGDNPLSEPMMIIYWSILSLNGLMAHGQSYHCPRASEIILNDERKNWLVPKQNKTQWSLNHGHNYCDVIYMSNTQLINHTKSVKYECWINTWLVIWDQANHFTIGISFVQKIWMSFTTTGSRIFSCWGWHLEECSGKVIKSTSKSPSAVWGWSWRSSKVTAQDTPTSWMPGNSGWGPGNWMGHEVVDSWSVLQCVSVNTLRLRDDTFNCIFMNKNVRISLKFPLQFVPKGPINNIPLLVQRMAWRRPGDKPLSEPVMVSLLTQICVTRPQWVKLIEAEWCIYASVKHTNIASDNSLLPVWHQAII